MECPNCYSQMFQGKCPVCSKKGDTTEKFDFSVVEEQIERNTQPRINWKVILGMTLTKAVAKFKAAGLTAKQTYDTICLEHKELTEEAKRRLKIGVCARFGEMGTVDKVLNKKPNIGQEW